MEVMSDKSIPEFAPFGFTLALRVAQLLKSEPHRAGCVGIRGLAGELVLQAALVAPFDGTPAGRWVPHDPNR